MLSNVFIGMENIVCQALKLNRFPIKIVTIPWWRNHP